MPAIPANGMESVFMRAKANSHYYLSIGRIYGNSKKQFSFL